jgi:hypothetical protein
MFSKKHRYKGGRNNKSVRLSHGTQPPRPRELIVTRLILAATEALKPGSRLYVGIVDAIREDHIRGAKCFIEDTAVLSALAEEIEVECGRLASILGAAQVTTSKNRGYEGDCDRC